MDDEIKCGGIEKIKAKEIEEELEILPIYMGKEMPETTFKYRHKRIEQDTKIIDLDLIKKHEEVHIDYIVRQYIIPKFNTANILIIIRNGKVYKALIRNFPEEQQKEERND